MDTPTRSFEVIVEPARRALKEMPHLTEKSVLIENVRSRGEAYRRVCDRLSRNWQLREIKEVV